MTGRTHDLAAATGYVLVLNAQAPGSILFSTALIGLVANLIGGITPDIDEPTAPLWRNLPIGGPIGKVGDKLLGGHRFLTHSLLGLALFGFGVYWLLRFIHPLMPHANLQFIWLCFMAGMVSHLILDTFTKEGVPWLLPIPYKFGLPPVRAWRITTGKVVENFVIFPGLVLFNIWFVWSYYQHLLTIVHKL